MRQQYKFYVRGSHESAIYQIRKLSDFYEKLDNSILMNVYADTRENTRVNQLELEDLLNGLEKGEIILVTRLDRLSRNVDELHKILKRIEEAGVELIVVEEQDSTVQQFIAENLESISTALLEPKEIQKKNRRKIDNPLSKNLYDNLYETISNRYEENKIPAYQRYGTKEQAGAEFIEEAKKTKDEAFVLYMKGYISEEILESILQQIEKHLG